MPNKEGIRSDDWRKYQVTVNKIESKTGYNLFSELSEDIQDELEGSVNRVFAGKSWFHWLSSQNNPVILLSSPQNKDVDTNLSQL